MLVLIQIQSIHMKKPIENIALDTFDQKLSIIRGLSLSGIKKTIPKLFYQTELKMMNKLSKYGKTIVQI